MPRVYACDGSFTPDQINITETINEILRTPVSRTTSINATKLKQVTDPNLLIEYAKDLRAYVILSD